MLYFDQIDVLINNTGIMCENASISSQNSISPALILGNRGETAQNSTAGINSTVSFSYLLDIYQDPITKMIDGIKNNSSFLNFDKFQISVAGVTGDYYLQNFSTKIAPNETSKANASFISFRELSGSIQKKNSTNYNLLRSSGLSHGWATWFGVSGDSYSIPTFDLSYEFKPDWTPIYKIGQTTPTQVQFLGAEENVSVTTSQYNHIKFDGPQVSGYYNMERIVITNNNIGVIERAWNGGLYGSGFNWVIDLATDVRDTKVKNIQLNSALDDIIRVNTSFSRYF